MLLTRYLWLVAVATGIFAAMQTVWMAFLALYLQGVVGLSLLAASRYLALAQAGGVLGRVGGKYSAIGTRPTFESGASKARPDGGALR